MLKLCDVFNTYNNNKQKNNLKRRRRIYASSLLALAVYLDPMGPHRYQNPLPPRPRCIAGATNGLDYSPLLNIKN